MFILFILLWIIMCARLTLEVFLIGLLLSALVYGFCVRHMGYRPETDRKIVRGAWRALRYIAVLVRETMASNIEVSRIVFARRIEIEPQIIFFRTNLKSEVARVALANSITLTPGTITVSLSGDLFCVHCLNRQMAEGIDESSFVRLLREFEADIEQKEALHDGK